MFHYILSQYHLQEKDWLYSDSSPVQVGHHFELKVKLSQPATKCTSCQGTKFHRHGTTPHPRKVQLTEYMGLPCFLMITIERYRCITCGMTQSSQIPEQLVLKGHKDATLLKTQIIRRLTEKESIKDASHDLNVSPHSFYRLLNQMSTKDSFTKLPQVLCVDEFKATKDCTGHMAFIAMDGETHEIVTVLDDRRLESLVKYFLKFPREVRMRVKYLVMDMNYSYDKLIKRCFPCAQLITDRFHVVQQMTKAFNVLRVQVMKEFDTKSPEYRHLKYYWKHLLKNYDDLSDIPFYSRSLRKWTTSRELVEQLINYSPILYQGWQVLQLASTHFRNKDSQAFFDLIESLNT
ncbi:ISL3 family transposase, partial [Pseudolactococcus chungangensis]